MKTKLTPERQAIRDKQISRWYDGNYGAALSYPYCIKRYLSNDLSEKIRVEIQDEINKWIRILESVPASKRCNKSNGCCWHMDLSPQDCIDNIETAIHTKILGHKIFVRVLETYRKGNGQFGVRVMRNPFATFGYYVNTYRVDPNHWCLNDRLNFELKFDIEKGLYYINEYRRVETEPIKITRRNWPRITMRKKFMDKVIELENNLLNSGVTINMICESNNKRGLEKYFIDCIGPEITMTGTVSL